MLSETQVRELYAQGEEAMVGAFLELQRQIVVLAGRMAQIEQQHCKNSRNSSKPPSSDGYGKPSGNTARRRKRGKRKPGGQQGHPGKTLDMVADPTKRSS